MALQNNPKSHQPGDLGSGVLRFSFGFVAHEKGPIDMLCFSRGGTSVLLAHSVTPPLLFIMLSSWTRPMAWERQYFVIISSSGLKRSGYDRLADSECSSLPAASYLMELRGRVPHAPCEDPAIYHVV